MTRKSPSKNRTLNVWGTAFGLALAGMSMGYHAAAAQQMVPLGSAAKFGVLAATSVTSSGVSTINGSLAVSPGNTVTGSPTVNGTTHLGDPVAALAQADLIIAYSNL